jgi:radical SAM superfamily enzyme YgiQ (UPF0313 family)
MKRLLLILPALQEVLSREYRQIKYSLFPPLSLLTLAGLTPPGRWETIVRDEHVEPVDVEGDVDLVAMTVYISSAHRAWALADAYRRRGVPVVAGGIHPTTRPGEALEHVDAVCIGPAESVWQEILDDADHGRLKRLYHGAIRGSAALVPTARRVPMNHGAYLVPNTIVTSRGCPHACDFCYKSGFWGPRYYEARPIDDVRAELDTFDGRFAFVLDDNFLANRSHARRVFELLRERGMVWQAAGSLDIAREPGFLGEAYAAGCRSLFVGFESISRESLRSANKRVNASADYAEAIRRFHDAGLMINGSFVFGFDADDAAVFDRTVAFAIEHKIETATFHIMTPYPGTPVFERLESAGRLLHRDWSRYDTRHAVYRPARMTPDELEAGYRRAYRDFYRFGSIVQRARGLPAPLKRIGYNVAWKKMDTLWAAIIHAGLLPVVRPVFERCLARSTRSRGAIQSGGGRRLSAIARGPSPVGTSITV